ncbi:MAG: hypothetical protein ACMG6E_02660 [Candidatus Roizmanbacteria bacterium]
MFLKSAATSVKLHTSDPPASLTDLSIYIAELLSVVEVGAVLIIVFAEAASAAKDSNPSIYRIKISIE